jgi:hypothetical protein
MVIQDLPSHYNHTRLGQHILQHSLMGRIVAPDCLVIKQRMVSRQWRVGLLQLATVPTVIGYGSCYTTTII